MKNIVVGTAGHIDHGKTALIKSLTGIDCDRLKEEKERGITIDLGFANLDLGDEINLGIVDVPGHERFVKNMLAGVAGIDLVILVIAADESIMPQTKEHLSICQLLGVKDGIVAITKSDLVDEEWLEMVKDEIKTFIKGTFLENKPVICVSSKTMKGLEGLKKELKNSAIRIEAKKTDAPFRIPIDRVFTIKGFGTVITGTLTSGKVSIDEKVEIYPKGIQTKVRGIHVHNIPVNEASAGQRTAINLQSIEKVSIERGDVLSIPERLISTNKLDVYLQYLLDAPKPLKNMARVRFHIGTNEVMARVVIIDKNELKPGDRGFCQLRLEKPLVALPQDRFVIRSYSPITTIGGGEVFDSLPPKHKRLTPEAINHFEILKRGDYTEITNELLLLAGIKGYRFSELLPRSPLSREALKSVIGELKSKNKIVPVDIESNWIIHRQHFEDIMTKILEIIKGYHQQYPLKAGMPKEELRTKIPGLEDKLFASIIESLEKAAKVSAEKDIVRLTTHRIALGQEHRELMEKIDKFILDAGFQTHDLEEILQAFSDEKKTRDILQLLINEGKLVKLKDNLVFHKQTLQNAEELLRQYFRDKKEISVGEFRELTGVSRKYLIPLLEYFDSRKITIRIGDKRILR